MNAQVLVSTADGVSIVGASVTANGGPAVSTDATGMVTISPGSSSFTVEASMPNYRDQSTTIVQATDGTFSWDDPGTIVSGQGDQVSVEIRLGRVVPAPTVPLDDATLRIPDAVFRDFKSPRNLSYAVALQHTFTVADGEYAFLFATKKNFWAAVGPTILGNQNAKGWGVFAARAAAIEPRMRGQFTWLEWAPPGGSPSALNRYLVGLWWPRSSVVPGAAPRDAIIFFSPTTRQPPYLGDSAPYHANYPYALNQGDGKDPQQLAQRYIGLGLRYVFNEKFFSYQLLAAARDALLIFPIQPAGHWEVFQRPGGIRRLLAESMLYEHRVRLAPDPSGDTLDTAPAGQMGEGTFVRTSVAQHLPPPALGTVVTAGFSAGMAPVKELVYSTGASVAGSARSWKDEIGDSYSADPTDLAASWREIWDFDGSANAIGTIGAWAGTLATWQHASGHYTGGRSDRVARCYHSDYTGWSAASLSTMNPMLGDPLPETGASVPASGSARAAERVGTNGTAVWFSKGYLAGNGPATNWNDRGDVPDAPDFWSLPQPDPEHQAVPIVCLAHAAGLSQLRKL
jgi:hypothetical protein